MKSFRNQKKLSFFFIMLIVVLIPKQIRCGNNYFLHLKENLCKKELLNIFMMKSTKMSKPRFVSSEEKYVCRHNRETCCSLDNIMSISTRFSQKIKYFSLKLEILEEYLTLFRGPKFKNLFPILRNKSECASIVNSVSINVHNKTYYFFEDSFQNNLYDRVMTLLEDSHIYLKNIRWFYGNVICTLCNPYLQNNFDLGTNASFLKVNIDNCINIFEERMFEYELMKFYNEIIVPIFRVLKCAFPEKLEELLSNEYFTKEQIEEQVASQRDKKKKYSTNLISETKRFVEFKINNEEYIVMNCRDEFDEISQIDPKIIKKGEIYSKTCYQDIGLKNDLCRKRCKKKLRYTFHFPDNMFKGIQISLSLLFYVLNNTSIEKFYRTIKQQEWKLGEFDDKFEFYENNFFVNKYLFDEINWVFSHSHGINFYKETISKLFIEKSILNSVHTILGLVVFIASLLII